MKTRAFAFALATTALIGLGACSKGQSDGEAPKAQTSESQ